MQRTVDINLTQLLASPTATLTYSGAPAGVTIAFAPNPDTGISVATVTVGSSVPVGKYTITVTGTGTETNHTNIHLVVAGTNIITTYSISGTISGPGGAGATVALSGTSSGTTTADGSGNYSFTGLSNGAYTVTPSKAGFNFTPGSSNETISGSNITGVNFSSAAAIALVASAVSPATGHTTPAIDTTGASLLVAVLSNDGGSQIIQDSFANNWILLTAVNDGESANTTRMAYCYSPIVGVGHTFTAYYPSYGAITVYAFKNTAGSTVDASNQTGARTSPAQPGSITPSAGAVVITGWGSNGAPTGVSVNDSFTGLLQQPNGAQESVAGAYLLNANNAPLNPTWTATVGAPMQVVIASFK